MSNVLRIKRRASDQSANAPGNNVLRNAELAFNEASNTLYYGRGGDATGTNANATPLAITGHGTVWTGTATFGTVNTTGKLSVGDEAYAYTNVYPPATTDAQGGKLLSTVEYVDEAVARSAGAGMSLHPVAADCATTVPLVAGSPYDNLQGFSNVKVAVPQPGSAADGLALYELRGLPTIPNQSVTLVAGDRVLIMGHLDPLKKGIWKIPVNATATTGDWTRETGETEAANFAVGARVFVTNGTYANYTFEVAQSPTEPTATVPFGFTNLNFIANKTSAPSSVPSGGAILFKRIVRAKSDYYQIINGKVVVDGVTLNQNDHFIWTPKNENPGGHNLPDAAYGQTTGSGTGDEGGEYDSPRAGIYRVNYSRPTAGDPYNVIVRARDLNTSEELQLAHNTKVLVREGAVNKNTIFTITTGPSFVMDVNVATFDNATAFNATAGSFAGTPVIDGYTTVEEQRDGSNNITRLGSVILVKNEVDPKTNGLYYIPKLSGGYTASNVPWIRHPTADETGELSYGTYIRVKSGNVNKNSGFVQVTNIDPLVINSATGDALVFETPSSLLDFRAGIGLARNDRTFYVKTAGSDRIVVTENGVDLAQMPNSGVFNDITVATDPANISTAYILVHADKYGRVTADSKDTITATELRNAVVGDGTTGDTTGTGDLVFSESPALTGVPTAPTADPNTNTTQIATTAYVLANGGSSILGTNNAFTGANTFTNTTGQTFRTGATADAIIVKGGGNTNSRSITLVTDTLSGSRTVTFPDHTGDYTLVGASTSQTLTNKTLTAPKMTGTHIADSGGNELIVFPAVVTSAVNEITVTNAITGARPTISASGGDTNIDLALSGKGSGTVFVNGSIKLATANATSIADVNGNEIIKFPTTVASAVNEITVTNAAANGHPDISATGGDTNINLKLTAKGTGVVNSASDFTVSSGKALNVSTATGLTAAGTTQGTALALTNDINVVATAAASTGVALPTGAAGRRVVVINRGANAITVYPATGGTIDALALNAGMALPINAQVQFYAATTTQWYSETVRAENVTGTLAVGNGGTGATTFTSGALLKGAGSDAITTATAGTDYLAPPSGTALLKANSGSALANATAGSDYVVGGTTTVGKIITQAATATSGTSSLLITASTGTPTAGLVSGDLWNTSGVLKFYDGSATKNIAFTDSPMSGNTSGTAAGLSVTLAATSGGTGQATYAAGDLLYAAGTNPASLTKLAKASNGTVGALIQDGTTGVPSWQTVTGTGNVVRATSPQLTTSLTTDSTTFALLDTTATTINAFRAATAITIGASSAATTTIQSTQASSSSTTGALVVSGGLGVASASFFGGNISAAGNGAISGNLTVTGNLTINGTTTTVNTNTLTVEDKNIELGSVAAVSNVSGTLGSGVPTMTVTSTDGLLAGQSLTKVSGTGTFGTATRILSVDSATQVTLNTNPAAPGPIVFNASGANDFTAIGGGVTVKGTTDKTFQITTSNILDAALANFTSSEHLNVVSGKTYKINDTEVLSSTTLGSGVTASSLQSVGALTSGSLGVGFTTVVVARGGTGQTTFTSNGVLLGNGTSGLQVTAAGSQYQVLRVPSAGGAPAFGAINLDQTAAVTGTLPVGNGGTGVSTLTGLVKGNGTANFAAATAGTDFVVGGTTTVGKIVTQAAIVGAASLLITPQSATPTTLAAGDLWNNAGTLKFYNGSATKDIATTDVSGGGTGATSFTSNGIVYGNGTSGLQVTAAGSQYQVLRAGSGGTPAFGAINLDQTAAVTGTLPVGNGGTGVSTLTGLVKGNGTANFAAATAGTDYVVAGTPTVGGLLLSTTTGITAAGTTQADATVLTNDINVVTTTVASTGVRLPAPAAGRVIAVVNRGANTLKVYPATSTAINTLGNNAAFSVAANATLTLRGSSTTQWYAELTAESPCSLVADCTLDGGVF